MNRQKMKVNYNQIVNLNALAYRSVQQIYLYNSLC